MSITTNITALKKRVAEAEVNNHRPEGSVRLLGVSKQHSTANIMEAFHAGLRDFGENYIQEALKKIQALSHLPIEWHYIGTIQSNKTKAIAEHFNWVHTLTSANAANRINHQRPADLPPLNVLIQLNLDDEEQKNGIQPEDAQKLATVISTLPNLNLRGLMLIPKPQPDSASQYQSFLRITQIMDEINTRLHLSMDTLSMGMTHDFEAAIRAGSTLVRIGTAIFGRRS
jgi:pyridoxal phosphate enzyme (YggS family)